MLIFGFQNYKRLEKLYFQVADGRITFVHNEDLERIYILIVDHQGKECFIKSEVQLLTN